jgi:hypothetical protein
LHEPVEVTVLFYFGLTPRHLKNSADTLMKYEKDNPQTAPLLQAFARAVMQKPSSPRPASQSTCPITRATPRVAHNSVFAVVDAPTIEGVEAQRLSGNARAPRPVAKGL